MYYLAAVLVIVASFLLILIVLVQNPKGGGLSSSFGGSNQYLGARKTTDFLEKATWGLAIALLVFSLAGSITIDRGEDEDPNKTILEDRSMPNESSTYSLPTADEPTQPTPGEELPGNLVQPE